MQVSAYTERLKDKYKKLCKFASRCCEEKRISEEIRRSWPYAAGELPLRGNYKNRTCMENPACKGWP